MTPFPKIVAVDFDGTCVTHEYPKIGRDIGAAPVLKRLSDEGAKIILWTMRSGHRSISPGSPLADAIRWFADNEIPLFGINANPDQQVWTTSPKAYAQLYIDDAALGCPLKQGLPGERPYVDWDAVSEILWPTKS